MKPLPPAFLEKARQARTDPVPLVDLGRLLLALREAAPLAVVSWRVEFERVFASRSALAGCAGAAFVLLAVAGWQAWAFWQDVLPWAQLIAVEAGGAS